MVSFSTLEIDAFRESAAPAPVASQEGVEKGVEKVSELTPCGAVPAPIPTLSGRSLGFTGPCRKERSGLPGRDEKPVI